VIRIAAIADVHVGVDSIGKLAPHLEHLRDEADVLLIAGDLTRIGTVAEARALVCELRGVDVPVVAVLGNHDYEGDHADEITTILREAGVQVLEGERTIVEIDGQRLGVAGTKGFGGGFAGACASDFGEPEMKLFIRHTQEMANRLEQNLGALDTDVRVALLHYSPVEGTLHGERLEIWPFLGSYLLGEAIDHAGADLAIHGHAHGGAEKGHTAGGIPVRNVAQPVIKAAYRLFCFDGST
jgi:Icc-related predicted phosphoesterase